MTIPKGWKYVAPKFFISLLGGCAFSSNSSQNKGIKWLKIANVGVGKVKWDVRSFLPESYLDQYSQYKLETPDIVVALTRPTLNGKLKVARFCADDGIALLNQRVGKVICNKFAIEDFVFQLLSTREFAYRIDMSLLGTDPPNLSINVLEDFNVLLPPLPEQQKIADILSTWDRAIEAQEKLITNSETLKKGLMQQLLTGKKRLNGFSGAWEEKPLEKIFHFKKGTGLSKGMLVLDGKNKCVMYGELYTRYNEVISEVHSRTDSSDGVRSQKHDILIPASTTTSGIYLANATAILEDNVLLSGDINILRAKKQNISSIFFAHYLTHIKKYEIARLSQGITIIHLYGNHLKDLMICSPPLPEQTAIAHILSDADREIELQKQKLALLKQEKSALMQDLLTGKRRVNIDINLKEEVA